jgi:hypothetical protein
MAEDITTAYMEVIRAYRKVEGLQPRTVPPMAPPVLIFAVKVELATTVRTAVAII